MTPRPDTGSILRTAFPAFVLPVKAWLDEDPAEVLYAGPAPEAVAGIMQINLRAAGRTGATSVNSRLLRVDAGEQRGLSAGVYVSR